MRRSAVMAAFAVTLAAAAAVSRPAPLAVLSLPAPGTVQPGWLDDGTPVFVSREPDGVVHVLGAVHPYAQAPAAVGWCPTAQRFYGVWTGSRFARDGAWLGGPSPHGLERFASDVADGTVHVRSSQGHPPRQDAPQDGQSGYHDQHCWADGPDGDLDLDMVVLHGEPFGDAVTAAHIRAERRSGTFLVHGAMLTHPDGTLELCDAVAGTPPACVRPGLVLPRYGHGGGAWFALEGYQRVRAQAGVAARATLAAVTRFLAWHDPDEPPREPAAELGPADQATIAERVLTVPAVDIDFPAGDLVIPAGTWTIRLANHGAIAHSLRMDAPVSWQVSAPGGQFARADSVALPPGSFTLYCAFPGHREAGMEFSLTVE